MAQYQFSRIAGAALCTALFTFSSFAATYYVATNGSDGNAGTEDAPFASIEKAVTTAAPNGDTVIVGEGTFVLPTDLAFSNTTGWKLRGAGIDRTILTGGSRHMRCFEFDHDAAELSGLTLKDVIWDRDTSSLDRKFKGYAIYLTRGVLQNVRITNASSAKTYWSYGTAIYMTGGRVSDCIIDGGRGAQGECYGIVYQSGGITERCTFYGNQSGIQGGALWLSGGTNSWSVFYNNIAKSGNAQGGAVRMSGGTLMHATISGNGAGTDSSANSGAQGGGLYHSGGVVTNCIVFGNSAPSQSTAGKPDWHTTKNAAQAASLIFNLCSSTALGTDPVALDPQFKNAAENDFSLLASSPCILTDGTTLGAIAYDRTKADAAMTVSPRTGFTTDAVSIAATVRNVANPVYSWTVTDASGASVKTSSDASFSSTFAAGTYGVSLVVTDGGTPVATDTRPGYFRIHPLTNYIEQASVAATATAEIEDAVQNAPDGQVIILGEGEWTLPNVTLLVDKNVKIFGQGVDKTILHGGSRNAVCFTVAHKDAELAGFTLDSLTWSSDNRLGSSACFNISAGFLHDLVVKDINCDRTGNMIGLGTYMTGGHIADIVYDNCHGSRTDMVMTGSGVRQTAGLSERLTIRNCFGKQYGGLYLSGGSNTYSKIYGNEARSSKAQGGGVTMTGGTLVHATIWGNGAGTDNIANTGAQGGGLYHSAGVVTNCIIYGNSAPSQTADGKPDWYTSKGATDQAKLFFNTCSSVAIGTNPIVGDPLLTDPANGDFSPTAASPCVFPTYTVGAVEYDRSQKDAAMAVSPLAAFDTETICFTSTVQNVSSPVYAWTVTDAGGQVVKTSSAGWFATTLAKGVYDVRLEVLDGETPVKTDEHLAYLRIYSVTNVIASGTGDALTAAVSDSLDGQIFLLEPGIHEVTDTVLVNNNLKIIGTGATNCVIKKTGTTNRAVYLNNEDALLTGVTVTGGRFGDSQRNSWGAGVLVGDNGGTVSYCVITNNGTSGGHFMRGGGVGITGAKGLVTHCLIAHNTVKHLQSDFGGGAALSAGRLENCLIRDNEARYGAGVAVSGSGKVRNCTIVNNTAADGGGGLCWWDASNGSPEIRNCVFSGNVADTDTSSVKPNVGFYSSGGRAAYMACSNSVFSCAYEGSAVLGEGSVALNDPFENAAADDWHLKLGVAGVDAGTAYADGDAFAETDFDGCARVIGDVIDMGAYETDTDAFGASMNLDRTEALENDPFAVSATVTGSDDYDCAWTVYGPNGAVVANYTGVAWTNGFAAVGRYDIEMTVTDRRVSTRTVTDRRNGIIYVGPRVINLASGNDLYTAVEAGLDGTKIMLSAGEYVITNKFKIQKGVIIEGPGYEVCTVRPATTIIGDRRVFHLNHAGAALRGITITGGMLGTDKSGAGDTRSLRGGGVFIDTDGGLVEDCRITGNKAGTYESHGGGVGINSAKGVVRNCLIDHNDVRWAGVSDETGGGAYLAAGVMSNCVICANRATVGGGVYFSGAATVASCTIASNTADTVGGVYFDYWAMQTPCAALRDSIICGNVDKQNSPRDGTKYAPEYGVGDTITKDSLINYCAFSEGTKLPTDDARNPKGVGNFTCDPGFKNFDKLDYRIHNNSPCAHASSSRSWLGALKPIPGELILILR